VGRTLHIVKSAGPIHPWDLLAQQTAASDSCSVVLIQDAVTATSPVPCPTFALARDVEARRADTPHPLIDDDRFLEMVWEADSVVVW
jgi:sulfur transfer complex TusBCD TusB component (DsrH family)